MRQEWAPYMTWAKLRTPPRYDLAGSNLLACTLDDLPGAALEDLNGANSEGWAPLVECIASRYGVSTEQVATGACVQAAAVLDGCAPNDVAEAWGLGSGRMVEPDPLVDAAAIRDTYAAARDR